MSLNLVIPNTDLAAVYKRIAADHGAMLQAKLEQVLNEHGISLDAPGTSLKIHQVDLKFIYTLERDGVALSTFGLELDLTGYLDYTVLNDLDIQKLLM